MISLVTRADDAGGCISANEAILEAVEAGAVRNISIMGCGAELEQAATFFAGRSDVCLGLHVTLNAEWDTVKWGPVLPTDQVPSLLQPGTSYFTPTPKDLQEKGFAIAEAIAEVKAQLERMRSLGLHITYLDEHMGVGWIASNGQKLRDALATFCEQEGLLDVHPIPFSRMSPVATAIGDTPAEQLANRWVASVEQAGDGTYLLVTHPGKIAPDMEAYFHAHTGQKPGEVAAERDTERLAFAHTNFVSECQKRGIRLLRYDEVQAHG
jgi:hypothetical protein